MALKNKYYPAIAVIILLSMLLFECIFSMEQESPVCDEVSHHIATGYSFLKTRDFRLNSTSPPLTEELSALPLLFLNPVLPLGHPSWKNIDRVTFGYEFLYNYNKNADHIVFWARIPMVILSLLCGILVFTFAKELYGINSGLFALFLYVFSPNIIAYSKLAIPDIGAAFFILLAIYRFYKFLLKPKAKNILLAGISLGLAQASKYSALILLPLFLLFSLYKSATARKIRYLVSAAVIFLICYTVVFISFFGEMKPLLKNDIDVPEKIAYIEKGIDKIVKKDNPGFKKKAVDFALNMPVPFATYIMNIMAETNMVFVKDFKTFLMGKHSSTGWWYYYIIVFLLKTTIPVIILFLISAVTFVKSRPSNASGEYIGITFLFVFIIISLTSKLQLSVRYLLPVYPLIFIYISKIMKLINKRSPVLILTVSFLSLWHITESMRICPYYISYFNQFAGGPDNGWRYLRDANIDYGQDLPSLAAYLRKNKIEDVKLMYSGTASPEYYGIKYQPLAEKEKDSPDNAIYAVSVNYIDIAKWTANIQPTAKAGKSIFIYDLQGNKK